MDFINATNMNLAKDITRRIDSQSETELGRQLTSSERMHLFERFKPEFIWNKIKKVCKSSFDLNINNLFQYGFGALKFLLLLCKRPELNCDFSPNQTPMDGNCLLHGRIDLQSN